MKPTNRKQQRTMCALYCISFSDVEKAHTNIQDVIHLTPVLTSSTLNQVTGRNLFFKCELFQKTGSFKIRGALNAIRSLIPATSEGKPKAVVTHSSGNHGQALTYAAKLEGIPAYIVVPQTAPNCKKLAIQAYGASIVYSEHSDESRENVTKRVMEETEGIMIHPNQEPAVIAGQGTIALEVLNQVPLVDAVVVPVGGGGMVAGIAITVKYATQLVWERMKLLIEPTAGVGVAAVLSQHFQTISPEVKNICIVLSGGNVDLASLTWVKQDEKSGPSQSDSV
ncbi:serine racemase isoform X3 [Elephas maximus indicus]|uniref:serine racemase isoform X3 n=1 Tax=Elephas maximus indicus TaxID=99487 RepID=UPI00211657A3|nr:serine racemase isoform X3 [Elephas maximus indicus]